MKRETCKMYRYNKAESESCKQLVEYNLAMDVLLFINTYLRALTSELYMQKSKLLIVK